MTPMDEAIMQGIKNLGARVCLEAAREYCECTTTPAKKKTIIKDLKGQWMDFLTNGVSKTVADELLKNEKEIAVRLKKIEEVN